MPYHSSPNLLTRKGSIRKDIMMLRIVSDVRETELLKSRLAVVIALNLLKCYEPCVITATEFFIHDIRQSVSVLLI